MSKAKLTLPYVGTRYGSPMGRRDDLPEDPSQPVRLYLERLKMVDSDYDKGGAYWGGWTEINGGMWCAWNTEGVRVFERAKTREEAKAKVRKLVPEALFYR